MWWLECLQQPRSQALHHFCSSVCIQYNSMYYTETQTENKTEGPGNEATCFVGNPALVLTWSFMSAPTVSPAGYESFWGEVHIRWGCESADDTVQRAPRLWEHLRVWRVSSGTGDSLHTLSPHGSTHLIWAVGGWVWSILHQDIQLVSLL